MHVSFAAAAREEWCFEASVGRVMKLVIFSHYRSEAPSKGHVACCLCLFLMLSVAANLQLRK